MAICLRAANRQFSGFILQQQQEGDFFAVWQGGGCLPGQELPAFAAAQHTIQLPWDWVSRPESTRQARCWQLKFKRRSMAFPFPQQRKGDYVRPLQSRCAPPACTSVLPLLTERADVAESSTQTSHGKWPRFLLIFQPAACTALCLVLFCSWISKTLLRSDI